MENAITINKIIKVYDNFNLSIKNLNIPKGYITGFIGKNGAGKTTTIKSILGMVKPNESEIYVLGKNIKDDKNYKEEIGYVGCISGFFAENKLKFIKKSVSAFYSNWDESAYKKYMEKFKLDDNLKYNQLSTGKKKQFELAIAFSHHPKLLIMDEPTANLDPIVRNEVIEIIQENMEKEDLTVFYSTHITSDLDKCADYIILIDDGRIILNGSRDEIIENHTLVKIKKELLDENIADEFISVSENSYGAEGLIKDSEKAYELFGEEAIYEKCSLEDILFYYTRRP